MNTEFVSAAVETNGYRDLAVEYAWRNLYGVEKHGIEDEKTGT